MSDDRHSAPAFGGAAQSGGAGPCGAVDGVVYTPPAIAREMVARALDPLVAGASVDALCALRICDPCVGEGAFAIAVVDYLEAALVARDPALAAEARARASRCVVGVDLDARALGVARAALPGADLRVADALAHAWTAEFDAVVGNPPYIRQERLARDAKARLRDFAVYDGVADLYVYFVELAHRLLRPGGRYCLIVPTKWMTAAYGRPLRRFLARTIHGLADHSRADVFADADAFPCVVWGASSPAPAEIETIDAGGSRATVPRATWSEAPWHVESTSARSLIARLARDRPTLGELVGRPQRGVVTGYNAAFVVDRATAEALLAADPANAAFVFPFVKGRDLRPFAIADAGRYVLLVDRGAQPTPSIRAHLATFRARLEPGSGRKPGAYAWYELQDPLNTLLANPAPRLLYQDIQTAPACALDDGTRVPDTTVWMLPTADRTILAILNSSLYAFYARHRFPPALNGAVRPKYDYLRHLPIAQPSPDLAAALAAVDDRARLDELVAEAYALSGAERRLVMPSITKRPIPTTSATSATLNTGHR